MSLARITFAAALLFAAAGCEGRLGGDAESQAPEVVSPAVASLRAWTSEADSAGFLAALRDSLGPGASVLGGTHQFSEHMSGSYGREFRDSTVVSLELTSTSWDSVMAVASEMTDRFLDRLAPSGEPLTLRASDPLPLGGARWRWLTGKRTGELRLRGEPRPGWPRNAFWAVSIAVTDRPATAYDRGLRPREVREVSRVVRWFDTLLQKSATEPSALVRWALDAGAQGTGMDGATVSTEGGRFAEERKRHQQVELQLHLGALAPDSIARAIAPRVEQGLRDAVGAHGTVTADGPSRWEYAGRGRAGTLVLDVHDDSGGRHWLDLKLEDTPRR